MKAFAPRVLLLLLMVPTAVLSHGGALWVATTTVSEADIIATEGF